MKTPRSRPQGVLCLHGFTGSPEELSPLVDALNRSGFRAQAPLIAGHGGDAAGLASVTREDWLASAHGALAALALSTRPPVAVVGASMGALLALDLAISHPGLVGPLVLIAPPFGLSVVQRTRLSVRRWLMNRFPGRRALAFTAKAGGPDVADPAAGFLIQPINTYPVRAVVELARLIEETIAALDQVTQPVLVVHGRLDRTVKRREAEEIARRLARVTEVETLWLDQSAHLVAIDRQRAAFAAGVVSFLRASAPAL